MKTPGSGIDEARGGQQSVQSWALLAWLHVSLPSCRVSGGLGRAGVMDARAE